MIRCLIEQHEAALRLEKAMLKYTARISISLAIFALLAGCATSGSTDQTTQGGAEQAQPQKQIAGKNQRRVVHVLVALCDNEHQGIVPVPAKIGNGDDPQRNLYWGARYGVKNFFAKSADWKLLSQSSNPRPGILERCLFKRANKDVYLVADAYRGIEIKQSIVDFLQYASGDSSETLNLNGISLSVGGSADLVAFVGHNGLMDFNLATYPARKDSKRRDAIILCCASRNYFSEPLRSTGANPLLWTTGLMAPEAYVLKSAIDAWVLGEGGEGVQMRAAEAYNTYQRCGLKAARNLFASGR